MYTLQPKKKSKGCVKVLAITGLVGAVVVGLFALIIFVALNARSYAGPSSSTRNIVYKVTTARDWGSCYWFDATYEMPNGTAQKSVSTCDGARSAEVDRRTGARGDFVYLAVQNDKYAARIGCRIYVDGALVFQTYSEGQYVIASCSGTIP